MSDVLKLAGVVMLLAALSVAAFLSYNAYVVRQVVPTADFGVSREMAPVRMQVGERHFEIPKAYLTSRANWDGGRQTALWAVMGAADLKPVGLYPEMSRKPGDPAYEKFAGEWNDRLTVNLSTLRLRAARELRDEYRKSARHRFETTEAFGLDRYAGPNELVYVLPAGTEGALAYIRCGTASPNCSATSSFGDLGLHYFFRATEISRWAQFDAATFKFLERSVKRSA